MITIFFVTDSDLSFPVKWNQCLALLALMNLQGNLILAVRTALSAMFHEGYWALGEVQQRLFQVYSRKYLFFRGVCDRGRRTEDGGPRTEDGGRMTDDGGPRTEDG